MTVDELVNKLQRPMFVYKYAKASSNSINPAMKKSARTRMFNAMKEIDVIVNEYCGIK